MYVDQRALRVDRVVVLERGSPNSICMNESGKILQDVKVTVVHPDTRVPCAHADLGEVSRGRGMGVVIYKCLMYGMTLCLHIYTL